MSETKTPKTSAKKGSTKTKVKKAKKNTANVPAKMSAKTVTQLQKTQVYNPQKAGSWDAVLQASRDADLENMSFSKKLNHYIGHAKNRLSGIMKAGKLKSVNFKNVKAFKDASKKYGHLDYISTHQAKLIVNGYIKSIDGNVARAERVAKQGGIVGKKADQQTRRGNAK